MENEHGMTVSARVTERGVVLRGESLEAFSSEVAGGRRVEKQLPTNSTLLLLGTSGEETTHRISHISLEALGSAIRIVSARDGETPIALPLPSARPTADAHQTSKPMRPAPPPVPEVDAPKKEIAFPQPLIQVAPEIERELTALLTQLATHMERVYERGQKFPDDPLKKVRSQGPKPWPETFLAAIQRKEKEFQQALRDPKFHQAAPEVTRSASRIGRFFGREILASAIDEEHPTFVASALLEILERGKVCEQGIPPALREAVRKFAEVLAERSAIGDGPYAVKPSRRASRFATFALARYEFEGVKDQAQLGYTDRRRTWKQLQATLASDSAARVTQEAAFTQVVGRMVSASTNAHAPGADADEATRKDYDNTLLSTIQSARDTGFYQGLTAAKKRAFDEKCAAVTGNIQKRATIPVDTAWLSTEGARLKQAGRAVKGKL